MTRYGTLAAGALLAFACAPALAQGDAGAAAPPALEIRLNTADPTVASLADILKSEKGAETLDAEEAGVISVRFASADAAVAFLTELVRALTSTEVAEGWAPVALRNADPRHVRSVLGERLVQGKMDVEVSCTMTPAQILLRGEETQILDAMLIVSELDVPPPADPTPEEVLRTYLERWLVIPEDASGPDYVGMYELLSQEARAQITPSEFAAIISAQAVTTPGQTSNIAFAPATAGGGYGGGLAGGGMAGGLAAGAPAAQSVRAARPVQNTAVAGRDALEGEVTGVYPPRLSEDGDKAVVGYSVSWFAAENESSPETPDGAGWLYEPTGIQAGGEELYVRVAADPARADLPAAPTADEITEAVFGTGTDRAPDSAAPGGAAGPRGAAGAPGLAGPKGPAVAVGESSEPAMTQQVNAQNRSSSWSVLRSEALVVRDAGGVWRLTMLFNPVTRTWSPPLSETIVRELAPELRLAPE